MKLRVIVLSAALLASLGIEAAQAAPTIVVGPMLIEGGEHVFTEQIIVTPGSTLTIRDATIWLDGPSAGATVCPLSGSVTFCNPNLFVMPGGTLIAERAIFDSHNPVVLNPASGGYRIYTYAGTIRISDSIVRRANKVGGELAGPVPSRITGTTFTDSLYPIEFVRGSKVEAIGNTIVASRQGIHVRDADSVIRDNYIAVGGNGIDVQGTVIGTDLELSSRAQVTGNTVVGGVRSFTSLSAYQITVRDNMFRDADVGALVGVISGEADFELPVIKDNTFVNARIAIGAFTTVLGGETSELAVPVHLNSILGTRCTEVYVFESTSPNVTFSVDARANWWGTPDGPQDRGPDCPAVTGPAEVAPWLTTAP